MSSDPAAPDEDPDAALLRRLALARGSSTDGGLREQLVMSRLLGRHVANIRRIVVWRAYSLRPSDADVDDIVSGVLIRLAEALKKEVDPSKSFRALVAVNIEWEVTDFARRRKRRFSREVHPVSQDFPDPAAPDRPTLADEARELRDRIAGLSGRDRQIVAERMLLGLKPEEIARRHGVQRQVVDTATSRALKKLLASDELADVRRARAVRTGQGNTEEEL